MDMQFYWGQDQVSQKYFCVYWNSVKFNLGGYYSKHHAEKHYHMVQPIYFKNNNPSRDITTNSAVGLQGCVYFDWGNAKTINPDILVQ